MRRHEREGVSRADLQGLRNTARWEGRKARGIPDTQTHVSFTVADRFNELGLAHVYWYRQHAWRHLPRTSYDRGERELVRRHIQWAAQCDRPRLP